MNTHPARQKWFQCLSPDGLLTRVDAVRLIHKHAANARVFNDLTDARIRVELPGAWLREHQQADMFRDAAAIVANDEHYPVPSDNWPRVWATLKDVFGALFR